MNIVFAFGGGSVVSNQTQRFDLNEQVVLKTSFSKNQKGAQYKPNIDRCLITQLWLPYNCQFYVFF